MANNSKVAKGTSTRKTVKQSTPASKNEVIVESASITEEHKEPIREKIVPKEIDLHQYIPVRSGVHGKLIYKSSKTGEKFVWQEFGEEQDMELQEIRNAKGSNKKFFEKNWFMFDDEYDWVIDYLGVRAFYKNALPIDGFDDLFNMRPADLEKRLSVLSEGQKKAVGYRARQLIAENSIDSLKVIDVLEKALNVELIER